MSLEASEDNCGSIPSSHSTSYDWSQHVLARKKGHKPPNMDYQYSYPTYNRIFTKKEEVESAFASEEVQLRGGKVTDSELDRWKAHGERQSFRVVKAWSWGFLSFGV